MNILISGGHLTPALAVIDYMLENNLTEHSKISFVGRIYSQDALKQKAIEEDEIRKRKKLFPKSKLFFIPFQATRFASGSIAEKIKSIAHFMRSSFLAYTIVKKEKPDVFLSFGGYVAVPIAFACWLQKIPIVTHEQTRSAGMANKMISVLASKVALSYEDSAKEFAPQKLVVTGNPVRHKIFRSDFPRPEWFSPRLSKPLLLIMGGNQGSQAINNAISKSLDSLLADWTIVHQCGKKTSQHNSLEHLEHKKENLEEEKKSRYFVREWITEEELSWFYRNAFGAISRAGANTVLELALVALPAIFIPLPFSHRDEQRLNAKWLVKEGGAILLEQDELAHSGFDDALFHLQESNQMMRQNLRKLSLEKHAAKKLYDLLVEVLNVPN